MAHITSIGAGMYSDLSICVPSSAPTFTTLDSFTEFQPLFANEIAASNGVAATNTFIRIHNIREFPAMGTPPNVVNVPVYGQKTSSQIQGQSDAPSMEITINYVPSEWAASTTLGALVGNGKQYVFRFTLLNARPTGTGTTQYASTTGAATLGSVENSQYFWVGKIEALQVTPQLTDANTATLTITMQSEFYGAYSTETA